MSLSILRRKGEGVVSKSTGELCPAVTSGFLGVAVAVGRKGVNGESVASGMRERNDR